MKTNNLSKISIIVFITLMLIVLSGCTRFDVELGIDRNNTAFLSYHLEIDISEFDEGQQHNFRVALHELALHYRDELNFTIGLDIDSSPIVMTAEKQTQNNSFEEAFETLEIMLTDMDMSVFMMVDMGTISYPRQTGYIIEAALDIPRIIKSNNTEDLPTHFQTALQEAIQISRGTVTISLPADESVSASHGLNFDNGYAIMTVPISFTEETTFDLSATFNTLGNSTENPLGTIIEQQLTAALGDSDETAIQQQQRFRNIAITVTIAAAALIVITLVVTIVVVLVRR